jgi:hypothetical protein
MTRFFNGTFSAVTIFLILFASTKSFANALSCPSGTYLESRATDCVYRSSGTAPYCGWLLTYNEPSYKFSVNCRCTCNSGSASCSTAPSGMPTPRCPEISDSGITPSGSGPHTEYIPKSYYIDTETKARTECNKLVNQSTSFNEKCSQACQTTCATKTRKYEYSCCVGGTNTNTSTSTNTSTDTSY